MMRRYITILLSVAFILAVIGCGGNEPVKKPPININPPKTLPTVEKPETPAELVWLNETFGKYFDDDGLKELLDNLPSMTAEEFEATLTGLGTDEDKPSEDDIAKAMNIFKAWKEQEAKKAAEKEAEAEKPAGE
ncbi:hypothetical protein J7L05_04985 [bacterium]|nr:hypothetical protein [bacterium]